MNDKRTIFDHPDYEKMQAAIFTMMDLLLIFIESHPEVDGTVWVSCFGSAHANACIGMGVSPEDFRIQLDRIMIKYEEFFDLYGSKDKGINP